MPAPVEVLMPIQSRTPGLKLAVPLAMLSEENARRTYGDGLNEIRQRGGMSAFEVLCNLEGVGLNARFQRHQEDDEADLAARVREWRKRQAQAAIEAANVAKAEVKPDGEKQPEPGPV